ncbi:protein-tyrosine-phosphatase [Caerostris extrusa]|uniref:Protein-tyrosine-phosphatase n=1 Tax=Caerostris extrusa TaxID=172846 RepID=A0AAV4Y0E8_CAEEX|nr:protein-tyrosine-phosphatase [Caerostris extrusa]
MVQWDEPYPSRGPIELYAIEGRDEKSNMVFSATTNSSSYFVGDLNPCELYHIRVCAKKKEGFGNWSNRIEIVTLAGVPMAPTNVRIMVPKGDSLKIIWDEPRPFRGYIILYTIRWEREIHLKRSTCPLLMLHSIHPTPLETCPVTHGIPYKLRQVPKLVTVIGLILWKAEQLLEYQQFQEISQKREQPIGPLRLNGRSQIFHTKPKEVKSVKVTNTSIELTWKEPSPSVGAVINYLVEWTDDEGQQMNMNANDLYCTIKNVSPYTNYSIKVRAETSAGLGKWGNSIVVRTQWRYNHISIITGSYCAVHSQMGNMQTSKLSMNGSTTTLSYCLKNLEPYTYYNIDVKAKTETAYGPWSEPEEYKQLSEVIPTIIRNLKEESKNCLEHSPNMVTTRSITWTSEGL